MKHVKVPILLMQEIVSILVRMPYASVGALMPKIDTLPVDEDVSAAAEGVRSPGR